MDHARPIISQLIEQAAERTPQSAAIVLGEESLSYRELTRRVRELAHRLLLSGVKKEQLVGLKMERTIDAVVSILAILRAGAAYVPLDPRQPRARLDQLAQDAHLELILDEVALGSLPIGESAAEERDRLLQAREPSPSDLAYVIFTSGSTGAPKGVLIEHRGLSNLVPALIERYHMHAGMRLLLAAPLFVDASVAEIFPTLAVGGTLVLASGDELQPGPQLLSLLRDRRITHVTFTPSMLATLPSDDLPALKTIIAAGEACPPEVINRWAFGRTFMNGYGPTEATVCASTDECTPGAGAPSIGRALPGVRLHVLDEHGAPVAPGAVGEIYISGAGVARGYLDRPDLTGERFVSLKSDAGTVRAYRTGDLGRFRDDGRLDFVGRSDNQVKVRGFRIELEEVEGIIRGVPGVKDAVAITTGGGPADRRLVAYVICDESARDMVALRRRLTAVLPAHMMPRQLVLLDAFPRTSFGKVDRKGLPPPTTTPEEPPASKLEADLARIWCRALGRDSISVTGDFADEGGDSLALARILFDLSDLMKRPIAASLVLNTRTVRALAKQLGARATAEVDPFPDRLSFNPAATGTPLFFVHPVTGNALCFVDLAQRLRHRRVVGLSAPGLRRDRVPVSTMDDLVTFHLRAMRDLQPNGRPYVVYGYSSGTYVALEIAQRLIREGERVALLGLIEVPPDLRARLAACSGYPPQLTRLLPWRTVLLEEPATAFLMVRNLGRVRRTPVDDKFDAIAALDPVARFRFVSNGLRRLGLPMDDDDLRAALAVHLGLLTAVQQYVPRPYEHRLAIFDAIEPHPEFPEKVPLPFDLARGPCKLHLIAGNHYTVLSEPNARSLAEQIEVSLSEIDIDGPDGQVS